MQPPGGPEVYLLSLPTHYPIILTRSETGPISVAKPDRSSRAEIQGNANCVLPIHGALNMWRMLGNKIPWSLQFQNRCRVVSKERTIMIIAKQSSLSIVCGSVKCGRRSVATRSFHGQRSPTEQESWSAESPSAMEPITSATVHVAPAVRINVRTEEARRPRATR